MTPEERAELVIGELCLSVGEAQHKISVEWVLDNINQAVNQAYEDAAMVPTKRAEHWSACSGACALSLQEEAEDIANAIRELKR